MHSPQQIDARDGRERAIVPFPSPAVPSPVVRRGEIVIATSDGPVVVKATILRPCPESRLHLDESARAWKLPCGGYLMLSVAEVEGHAEAVGLGDVAS